MKKEKLPRGEKDKQFTVFAILTAVFVVAGIVVMSSSTATGENSPIYPLFPSLACFSISGLCTAPTQKTNRPMQIIHRGSVVLGITGIVMCADLLFVPEPAKSIAEIAVLGVGIIVAAVFFARDAKRYK